jgi:hypothetical protein
MVDWKVVVPSYNRVEGFRKKTLATLQQYKIPASKIYLFVANEEQKKLYEEGLEPGSVGHIVVGEKGLPEIRNFIFDYFPKDTPLVSFDDDVRGFVRLDEKKEGKLRDLRPDELGTLFDMAFAECKKSGAHFWGDYPVANGYFMSNTITYDFKFIIGSFWGCYNPGKDVRITMGRGEKEDYMRAIQFWERDDAIVRLNFLAHKTATYNEAGGLQSDGQQARIDRERETVGKMLSRWPQYVRANPRRKGPYPEILLIRQPKEGTRKVYLDLKKVGKPGQTEKGRQTGKTRKIGNKKRILQ